VGTRLDAGRLRADARYGGGVRGTKCVKLEKTAITSPAGDLEYHGQGRAIQHTRRQRRPPFGLTQTRVVLRQYADGKMAWTQAIGGTQPAMGGGGKASGPPGKGGDDPKGKGDDQKGKGDAPKGKGGMGKGGGRGGRGGGYGSIVDTGSVQWP